MEHGFEGPRRPHSDDSDGENGDELGTVRPADEGGHRSRIRGREGDRSGGDAGRTPRRRWSSLSDEELLRYYRDHHEGLSRGELRKSDAAFYNTLSRRGLLEGISKIRRSWLSVSDDELIRYYHEHYEGLSRSKLHGTDAAFSRVLRQRGLLREVPNVKGEDWVSMSDDELIRYYHTHYHGLSRGKLQHTNSYFYNVLRRRNLLDKASVMKETPAWSWASLSDAEIIRYYHEHYEDLSRGKLQYVDRMLYSILRRRKLLGEIPLIKNQKKWISMSNDELLRYYHDHYKGISRGRLQRVSGAFCTVLFRRGLINKIPTIKELKEQGVTEKTKKR